LQRQAIDLNYEKTKIDSMPPRRWCEFVVFVAFCLVFGYAFAACSKSETKPENLKIENIPANENKNISPAPSINPNADFSKFDHKNAEHARFPCALCHERTDNAATPKLVGHLPCAGCHTAQFADNQSKICTICHTNTESGTVKNFPPLKTHNVIFDHAKHLRQTNCADCHKPSGERMTILSGFNAHNACFRCHTPEAKSGEKDIASCNACHQDGNFVKVSTSAKTYASTPFSHASHRLDCTTCHSVRAGASRGRQVVTLLVAKMHFPPKSALSCASCHNKKRTFGGDNFSDCRRCHQGNNFQF
jgi:hypothetical protein